MRRILRGSPGLNISISGPPSEMPCPFLSRLSSTFVKNYSGKLLKTYGDHCPVMTKHGVTAAVSQPLVRKLEGRDDTIEVREGEAGNLLTHSEKDLKNIMVYDSAVKVRN